MNDLISRQDAIDALKARVMIGRGNGKSVAFKIANDYADFVRKRIEALPSAQPESDKWISTAERLPDKPGQYLVTIKHQRTNPLVCIRMLPEKFNRWRDPRNGIKAWMKCPEPYEGET